MHSVTGSNQANNTMIVLCRTYRSSPGISSCSPGNSPSDKTHASSSISSADSGVFRMRPLCNHNIQNRRKFNVGSIVVEKMKSTPCAYIPTTNSRISFHLSSGVGSCTMVIRIRRCMPWCNKNRPRHGKSSLCSTTDGTYSPLGANSQISNQTKMSCLASTVDDGGHGSGPNFGERTGWLIGMLGGNIRRGGGLV